MKKRQIIILGSSFLIFLFMVFWVSGNAKMRKENGNGGKDNLVYYPVVKVTNEDRDIYLSSYGQISSYKSIDINSEVSGKLKKGSVELKPGVKFRKGQVLVYIENDEVWYNLASRKGSFINMVAAIMPDIKFDFPSEYKKWDDYLKSIKLNKDIPELPSWNSDKEKILIASKGVLAEFFSIKSLEANTHKYQIRAPFDGTILESFIDVGTNINMGSRIIKVIQTGNYEVKVPMSLDDLEKLREEKEVEIFNSKNELIGVGLLNRYTNVINQSTQSVDVYFKIKPLDGRELLNGMYINIALKGTVIPNAVILPRRAVSRDSVYLVQDSSLMTKSVNIERFKGDSVYVTGLNNGDRVVINSVGAIVDSLKVVGIER